MIKLSPRALHSEKLRRHIEEWRREEFEGLVHLLTRLENSGKIEYAGQDAKLDFERGTGSKLQVTVFIQKLEFIEQQEVPDMLRKVLPLHWSGIIDTIEQTVHIDEMINGEIDANVDMKESTI
jgi:hypothetical protein